MSLICLIGAYAIALVAIVLSWKKAPKEARVRYRFGLGLDTTSSPTVAMIVYMTIADLTLVFGLLQPDLRWWGVGLLLYTAYAGATALRNFV